jgi:hypothetical protein
MRGNGFKEKLLAVSRGPSGSGAEDELRADTSLGGFHKRPNASHVPV